jgi:hypothetical protein
MARARLLDQIVGRLSLKEMKELAEIMVRLARVSYQPGKTFFARYLVVVAGVTKKVNKYNYQCGPSIAIASRGT